MQVPVRKRRKFSNAIALGKNGNVLLVSQMSLPKSFHVRSRDCDYHSQQIGYKRSTFVRIHAFFLAFDSYVDQWL